MDKEYSYDYAAFIAPHARVQEYLDQFSRDWHIAHTDTHGGGVAIIMEQKYEEGTSHSSRPDLSRLNNEEHDDPAAELVWRKVNMNWPNLIDWVSDAIEDPKGDDLAGDMLLNILVYLAEQSRAQWPEAKWIRTIGDVVRELNLVTLITDAVDYYNKKEGKS